MLERKRAARGYRGVGGDAEPGSEELELGQGTGPQETGVTGGSGTDLDAELDHWDENAADDWDDEAADPPNGKASGVKSPPPPARLNGAV